MLFLRKDWQHANAWTTQEFQWRICQSKKDFPNTVFKKPITYKKGREGLNWLDSCSYAALFDEERHVLTYHFMIEFYD